jgi:hypothetical protein
LRNEWKFKITSIKMLRELFGPKRDKVSETANRITGKFVVCKSHLISENNKIFGAKIKRAGHVARAEETMNAYRILVGNIWI